jgi:hypothetical protein
MAVAAVQLNILIVGPKAGSPFTWQSIVTWIQTFKRGYIWRVGNDDLIQIWKDTDTLLHHAMAAFYPGRRTWWILGYRFSTFDFLPD